MIRGDGPGLWAPAKINLYLHLTGRRSDGYHMIDSVFVFVDLADYLTAEPVAEGLFLQTEGPWAGALVDEADSDNLVLRAAHLLRQQVEEPARLSGVDLTLIKNIPVAAGIGGGSADAAAALRLLMAFWKISLPEKRVKGLAEKLGADVPACLISRPVHVRGTGEIVTPAGDNPDWGILLVNPRVAVSTARIFRTFAEDTMPFSRDVTEPDNWHDLKWLSRHCRNDLEAPAIKNAPVIGTVLSALRSLQNCQLARMSGSGATCFALFESKEQAQKAEQIIAERYPLWWCWAGGFYGSV